MATTTTNNGATVDNLNVLDTITADNTGGAEIIELIDVANALFPSTNATQTVTIDTAFWTGNLKLTFGGSTAGTYFTLTGSTDSAGHHFFAVTLTDQYGNQTGSTSGPLAVTATTASLFISQVAIAASAIGGGSGLSSTSLLDALDIVGGSGKNVFQATTNGQIANIFTYSTATDSFNGTGSQWDVINSFNVSVDKLDFRQLVNDTVYAGVKTAFNAGLAEFIWLGQEPANTTNLGAAGAFAVWYTTDGSGGSFVYADTNGDGVADLKVNVAGVPTLTPNNFFGVDPPAAFTVTINPIEPSQSNQWLINAADANAGVTVTGTVTHFTPSAQLTVTLNGHPYTATVLANGTWSATILLSDLSHAALPDGTYTLSATVKVGSATLASASHSITVDETAPTVTSVALNDALITDADATLTRTATITFSEAMDQTSTPTVTNNAGSTLTSPTNGHWVDATHYAVSYTVADANVTLADVTFNVSGAKDVDGNTQVAATAVSSGTAVDTQNPTVTSVALNDTQITDADATLTRTATITFSEAMDQTSTPVIANNAGTTLTSPTGGHWVDATHYAVNYTAADANVSLADITFNVSGAKDLAGNTQTAATNVSSGTSVDTLNPTVSSVVINDTQITDADATLTRTATITFSEVMDQTSTPTISNNAGTTLTSPTGGHWVDATHYAVNYTAADANVSLADITFNVSGAKDLAGNTQTAATNVSSGTSVDTLNPTVSSVVINDTQITDADATLTRTATITFSEAMDQTSTPTISNNAGTTLTSPTGGHWVDATHYAVNYTAADANVSLADITFNVSGAKDLAGNTQTAATNVSSGTSVDTLNPTVSSVVINDTLITDADTAATVTATITFSEAMDTSSTPVIANNAGSTLTSPTNGQWTDATHYTVDYTVADANTTLANVTFNVSAATDVDGNTQVAATNVSSGTAIDTQNPTVTSVTLSDPLITDADTAATVTATITFSEAMDTSSTPVIANNAGSTLTSPTNGQWTDATHYTVDYTVADANTTLANVTFNVSAATDVDGNTQVAATNVSSGTAIDTQNPTVTSVTLSDPLITDADTAATVTATITFSEAMDTSSTPVIANNAGSTLTSPTNGQWTDATHYTVDYTVADANTTLANVTFNVSAATDVDGNTQVAATNVSSGTAIDTQNPTVTSVTLSDPLITDADTAATVTATITFSEAMDTSSTPVIANNAGSTLTSPTNGQWTDATHYTVDYTVADANTTLANVTFNVSAATDVDGNTQVAATNVSSGTAIDTQNPTVTSVTLSDPLITDADTAATVTATITFSEAMDTSSTPVIANNAGSTLTSPTNGQWTDATHYTVDYTVADANTTLANVTFNVSAATDVDGNTQVAATNVSSGTAIDTQNPTVTSVTLSDPLITDADTAATVTATITFSEAMDTSSTPVIANNAGSTLTSPTNGQWTDATHYTVDYTVADANTTLANVTFNVSAATDVDGNTQVAATNVSSGTAIDTQNPTVTSVTLSDPLITDADTAATVTATITFSEAMDTSSTPVIANNAGSTLTSPTNGQWTDATHYTVDYTVADANTTLANVTFNVSAATDVDGNTQVAATNVSSGTAIDTQNPTVTSVTLSDPLITDADTAATVTATITFSEAMDTSSTPVIANNAGSTLTSPTNGQWTDATHYTVDYTVADANTTLANVTFNVSAATDVDGNTQVAATNVSSGTAIDTQNPTVTSVTLSDPLITDADTAATVTATITFSEAMDTSSTPVIANNAGSTLTSPTNGQWTDATHYTVDYTVADANTTLANVTFNVSAATDVDGNTQVAATNVSSGTAIDTQNPTVTSVTLSDPLITDADTAATVTATITFSEAMDTSSTPVIANNAGSTLTSPTNGQWTDATHYTVDYTVADANTTLANVTFNVSAATDVDGNTQVAATNVSSGTAIDTQNPTVTSVTLSDPLITDADTAATVTATITFSEAMDTSSTPVIANNAGSTLTSPTNGQWTDATHYTVDYTVADANTTLANVTFNVSAATDVDGNTQVAATNVSSGTAIDTQNPTVTSVTLSDPLITDADTAATVTATITFSEAMDTSSTPVIANNAGSTLTSPTNGQWTDATHYTVDYTVADANTTLANVTFNVSAATDVDGNTQVAATNVSSGTAIDTQNPTVTSVTLSDPLITDADTAATVTATITFSEAMDTSSTPVIANNAGSTLTSPTNGQWTDATHYTVDYTVADANTTLANVTFNVSAATDVDGNTQVAATNVSSGTAIDTQNPTVTSVTLSDPLITDADTAATVTATITFSEAMDTSSTPVIANNAGSTLTSPTNGQWTDATHYTVDYTVADANTTLANVTFNVSAATDVDGNTQVAATNVSSGTAIDTQNPTVTSVTLSDPLITDADTAATVTATITFSEAMDTSSTPVIANNAGSTLTSPTNGQWTDATHYTVDYTVADANTTLANVTFNVSAATDVDGNTQVAATNVSSGTAIDTQNPTVTSVTLSDPLITDADTAATVTATITFSEAMDTSSTPVIANNAGSTLTSPTNGQWTDATHYTVDYTVADANTTLANVTFNVSAATDVDGNTQVAATNVSSGTAIDTQNPTVTSVTLSDPLITDADTAATVTATITFSEAMDTSSTPVIANNAGSTLTSPTNGQWTDATHYTVDYTVADANTTLANVTFNVSAATDVDGNTQVAATNVSSGTAIDTQNPTVTSVTLSDPLITDADTAATVTATITFSEAMDTSSTPVIANNAGSTLTSPTNGQWTDATHYTVDYTVADANTTLANVTFNVSAATDVDGNTQVAATNVSSGTAIDTQNPTVTSVTLSDPLITDADTAATVTATITFSEAMDTSSTPVIANNAGSTLTSPTNGQWTDATHYTVDYTVADANTTLANVTFNVSGAKDLAGNTQTAATNVSSGTSVDTLNPTVSSVVINDTQITDADATLTRTATITFSEAMDQTSTPVIANNAGTTLTSPTGGHWVDATHYAVNYTAADANVSLADITFNVSGAKDLAGNTQTAATNVSSGTSVDTLNPTVSSVVINDTQITDADATLTRTATITFSEAMDQTSTPTISNNAGTTLTSPTGGHWVDATHYAVNYTAADANVSLADITFNVSGAKDLAGNTQTAATNVSSGTSVDTLNPTVSSEAITSATGIQGTWLNANDVVSITETFSETVTVTGTPQLALTIGSTTVQANYVSGSGSSALVFTYTILANQTDANGIAINTNALSLNGGTIRDAAGNAATLTAVAVTDNISFKVDTTAPTVTKTNYNNGTGTLTGSYSDSGSGVVTVNVSDTTPGHLNSGNATLNAGTWTYALGAHNSGENLTIIATDTAGNQTTLTTTAPAGIAGEPINISLTDPSANHVGTVAVTIAGVPTGWSLSAGTNNGDGTWTVGTNDIVSLAATSPESFTGALVLNVTETWTNADGTTGTALVADNVEAYAPGSPIFAWSGDDTLSASSGNDLIVFAQPIGNDIIHNFDVMYDKIDLIGFNGISNFSDVQAHLTTNGNGDGVITIANGESITLQGVNAASLTADDFVFDQTPVTNNAGTMTISDGAMLPLSGIINSAGTIELNSAGNETDLQLIQHGITLEGGGQVVLSDSSENVISGTDPSVTLTNVDNTISGAGQLGDGQMTLVNDGTIDATGANALVLDTGSNVITNSGILEATGSGGLIVNSAVDNSGSLLADGGNLTFNGAVTGNGTATISGAATLEFAAASAETVNFAAGSTGALKLDDSAAFTGSVSGLTTTTYIDFADLAWEQGQMTASFSGDTSGGKLTVSDGIQSDTINLVGDYTQSGWTLSQDSNGKTLVVDPPLNSGSNVNGACDTSAILLAQYAAAGFQSGLGGGAGGYATMPTPEPMLGEAPPLTKPTA